MIRPLLKRILLHVLAWMAVVAFSAVVALAQAPAAPTASGQRTDGQIEMDVVHALDAAQALKNDLITAATIQGKVTLAGTVASQANKELAGAIVSQVPGVAGVQNNLKIGNPQQAVTEPPPAEETTPDLSNNTPPQPEQPGSPDQPSYTPIPPPDGAPSQPPYPGSDYPGQAQAQPYPGNAPGYPPSPYNRPQYTPENQPAYQPAAGPVTVPQGTLLQVRTSEPVDSKRAVPGTPVQFTVIQDVTLGGTLAIPRGATVHGVITDVRNVHSGQLAGSPVLALTLTSLDLGGKNYPLRTDSFRVKGPNKAGRTVGSALGGGLIGTLLGCAIGRGVGCAIGAGTGLAAGTAASAASGGPSAWIPAEALVDFHLAAPVTVDPVSPQEAARLAQGLYPGGPTLYRRRGYSPYAAPYGGYPYYAYPPIYYRPYYMMGGFYYWR